MISNSQAQFWSNGKGDRKGCAHLFRPMHAPRQAGAGGARGTRPITPDLC
jgi:hypothetical protein